MNDQSTLCTCCNISAFSGWVVKIFFFMLLSVIIHFCDFGKSALPFINYINHVNQNKHHYLSDEKFFSSLYFFNLCNVILEIITLWCSPWVHQTVLRGQTDGKKYLFHMARLFQIPGTCIIVLFCQAH